MPYTNHFKSKNNDASMKFWGRVPFEEVGSILRFSPGSNVRNLLHGLKYEGLSEVGEKLGELAANRIKKVGWFKEVDVIIPVPIHPIKRISRGYNQCEVIARKMGKLLGIPVNTEVLIKAKNTRSQTGQGRLDRIKNVLDSFLVMNQDAISGKHILLVDDVLTTGATLEACALKLLEVSNVKLSAITICIASRI